MARRRVVANESMLQRLSAIAPVIGGIMAAAFTIVVWVVKTNAEFDARIKFLEASQSVQDRRLDAMDSSGTHHSQLFEERQKDIARQVDYINKQIIQINDSINRLRDEIRNKTKNGSP